ncbi:MAG: 23S rRNA (adenine(2030)-N(6))-methyltransferase RlmJ [Azoarcus sp.]|jgi:23S rRNA (adenine2030-N6)-methyltransferase|nr:23S rRNA (adenine(2030)-N(6))-methyltransferase RlmJ [Azoarcus sp.]
MLSYRHAFHAGNHGDVIKHFVLAELLAYYGQKEKPWTYIDTHAGAGCYTLNDEIAGKTREFAGGIGRLWDREGLPAPLADYANVIRQFNPGGRLVFYPGSPAVAMVFARERDNLHFFERHPADLKTLRQTFRTADSRRAHIHDSDGFAGLSALLPPPSRRAVVLIDPSYEIKTDYARAVSTLAEAIKRFPAGCYVLWYPLLARPESRHLPKRLAGLGAGSWLDVRLRVCQPVKAGFALFGSGLFIVNPPWILPDRLKAALPLLVKALGVDEHAGFDLDYHIE